MEGKKLEDWTVAELKKYLQARAIQVSGYNKAALLHFVSHTFLRIGSFFTVGNLAQPLTSLFFFLESDEQSATAHTKLVIARCCGLLRDGFRRKRGECLQTLLRQAAPRRCHDEPIFSFTSILMALSSHVFYSC